MHEFGITSRIVATVSRVAQENEATKVVRVDLVIGQLTFLSIPQVKLTYEILTKGTPLQDSELSIQESEGIVRCQVCDKERKVSFSLESGPDSLSGPLPLFSCSACGGKVTIIQGKECEVTGIALEAD
ncbi:MAG: hydrogenase maturation nickel metallochaperone HypA [Chloroflexi bacterium]|nr:hydrogenase maturation nickel metallochaperone HypA [Chloroflexota bacterium]